jgi:hypothetical protein
MHQCNSNFSTTCTHDRLIVAEADLGWTQQTMYSMAFYLPNSKLLIVNNDAVDSEESCHLELSSLLDIPLHEFDLEFDGNSTQLNQYTKIKAATKSHMKKIENLHKMSPINTLIRVSNIEWQVKWRV